MGFLYPAYASFKAIETKAKDDDTQWLTYWIVFALFNVFETFVDWILYWIPFFYALKLAALVYLMLPQTRGAEFIYKNVIRSTFIAHQVNVRETMIAIDSFAFVYIFLKRYQILNVKFIIFKMI